MGVHIIIGKGFGDEGKGLAADYFAGQALSNGKSCLVIKHNGGAQAGHTVDRENSRFIFHQLSSGSLQQGAAYWAAPFLPDLYKLPEEVSDFQQAYGFCPPLYANIFRLLRDLQRLRLECRCSCFRYHLLAAPAHNAPVQPDASDQVARIEQAAGNKFDPGATFGETLVNTSSVIWVLIFLALTIIIVLGGVSGGIMYPSG